MSSLNPLLAKIKLPGRVFQLPSKGLFYPVGMFAESVKDAEVQVKPMSALTEIKVRSADLLYSAKVIGEVCAECVPEILKPELLLSKDVDALFLFLVAATYGNTKTIKSMHNCKKSEAHDYQVDLEKIIGSPNNKILEHRAVLYRCELPNGQVVNLKPVSFQDSIEMMLLRQAISRKELNSEVITHREMEDLVVRDLMSVIESVTDGLERDALTVTDRTSISEWVRGLSRTYDDLIVEAAVRAAEWGFNFTVKLKCKDCGAEYDHEMELNPVNFLSG